MLAFWYVFAKLWFAFILHLIGLYKMIYGNENNITSSLLINISTCFTAG